MAGQSAVLQKYYSESYGTVSQFTQLPVPRFSLGYFIWTFPISLFLHAQTLIFSLFGGFELLCAIWNKFAPLKRRLFSSLELIKCWIPGKGRLLGVSD